MAIYPPPIVVGIDDSSGAEAALEWAVEDAGRRGLPLRLVCAYRWTMHLGSDSGYANLPEIDLEQSRKLAEQAIALAIEQVHKLNADVVVDGEVLDGAPALMLISESNRAATVVLGSRHLKALGSNLLGSVGTAVSARAHCPVVVVRGPGGDPVQGAQVVAGLDGTAASGKVLEFAFDYAAHHGLPLHAVLCWHPDPLALWMWRAAPPAPDHVELWLAELLAGWSERYPDVLVRRSVVREIPAAGLVLESSDQQLLVVGTRGTHALAGTLLGSVSQGVLHHATCPVAVVPTQ